ncbi:transposase [Streptomyces sp. NPDC046215]|uniref:Insertion element IS402-like domain-containing protein n=1 Tax=Streptomyces stramineus TaxID=173861 RepID=A0ABN1A4J2_9ACTN
MPARSRRRRYPSDTTVAEWALLEPLLPAEACQKKTGSRPEKWHRRDIVDAIRYLVDNGAKWRALPADFPPWSTVYYAFRRWVRAGVVASIRPAAPPDPHRRRRNVRDYERLSEHAEAHLTWALSPS